jgi:hypothetical protein
MQYDSQKIKEPAFPVSLQLKAGWLSKINLTTGVKTRTDNEDTSAIILKFLQLTVKIK